MSGICGIFDPGREPRQENLAPMLDSLSTSGESEPRVFCSGPVALGVSPRWHFQQGATFDGIAVVADADLVDLQAISDALGTPLPANGSLNAAELIARLYRVRGLDFLRLLQGAFSVALWDERARRLCLAIDRIGVKSLYWRKEKQRLLFAARVSGIRAVQETSPEVNPHAILQFVLFASIPAPLSSDDGTQKLRPGVCLIVEDQNTREYQYWDVEYPENEEFGAARWSEKLRDGMRSAVHRHLEGCDRESTGCYLSGGTDSSSVVAFASEKHHPAQSFSIAFEEAGFSEIEFARTTAARFKTQHHEKFLSPIDATAALSKVLSYYDEPFANSSAIGSYYCAVLAKENGVGTLLAGDGGDELFGGNERYATDKRFALYHTIPAWCRRSLIEPLVALLPDNESKISLPRRYVRRANIPNPRRILSYGFFLNLPPDEVFEEDFLETIGRDDWLAIPEGHFRNAKATSELNRILYLDLKMTLADNDLRKVSGTAELAGVNVRYPLLDTELIELSGRIPASLKLKGFEKRYLFKQAMKDILPTKVLYKKKHGFGVPLAQWLLQDAQMNELMRDLMHDSRTHQRGYFRSSFIQRLMGLHKEQPNFYGEIVWYLVALELWHRQHLERRCEPIHAA